MDELVEYIKAVNAREEVDMKERQTKRLKRTMVCRAKLEELRNAGINITKDKDSLIYGYIYHHIENLMDFRIIKKVFGDLKLETQLPCGSKRNTVKAFMVPVNPDYDGIHFTYLRKLPKNAKCKVKTVVTRRRAVVCEK